MYPNPLSTLRSPLWCRTSHPIPPHPRLRHLWVNDARAERPIVHGHGRQQGDNKMGCPAPRALPARPLAILASHAWSAGGHPRLLRRLMPSLLVVSHGKRGTLAANSDHLHAAHPCTPLHTPAHPCTPLHTPVPPECYTFPQPSLQILPQPDHGRANPNVSAWERLQL